MDYSRDLHTTLRHAAMIAALAALGACERGGAPSMEPYVIKFPHVTAPATPKGRTAQRLKELAEQRFPGRVIVEVYPSGQLMNEDDALEALAFGEVQMTAVSLSKFDRLTDEFQIFDLPFLFPDLETVEAFQASPAGQDLLNALSHRGFHGLAFWHNGMKQLTATRPLNVPDDARGLQFRIMASDVLQAQTEAIGAIPQKMALGEVYQALQVGTIDAQENTWSNIYSSKLYEVQPFIMESNHGYVGYLLAVNAEFWDSLPDDVRVGLEDVIAEVTAWGNAHAEEINQTARRMVLESGRSEVIELTDEQVAQWRSTMAPVWKQFEQAIGVERIEAASSVQRERSRDP
jgi:C4-dicarboxylate-binding protein DctP